MGKKSSVARLIENKAQVSTVPREKKLYIKSHLIMFSLNKRL